MNFWLSFILLIFPVFPQASGTQVYPSTSASGPTLAPNQQTWALARSCSSQLNCTQINANTHYVIDATSNSTTTVTCPNSDCNFTSNDTYGRPRMIVGQKIWATTQGAASPSTPGYLTYTTYVCPVTTVASFTANSVVLNLACTANGTANVVLIWGSDDGATLAGLDATVGCALVQVPDTGDGFIMDSQPFLKTSPACATATGSTAGLTAAIGTPAPGLIGTGQGTDANVFVITPDFAWTSAVACTGASQHVAIGCSARFVTNVAFWGTGLTSASNSNCANGTNITVVEPSPVSSVAYGLDVAGVCPGETGMRGIEIADFDGTLDLGGAQEVGVVACAVHGGQGVSLRGNLCEDVKVSGGVGLTIDSGAIASDYSSWGYDGVVINGNFTSRGTTFPDGTLGVSCIICINSGGVWNSYSDFVGTITRTGVNGGASTAVTIASGGQHQTMNTIYGRANANLGSSLSNAGTVISLGGNKLAILAATSSGGVWSGSSVLIGSCRGTATSSSTLGLYALGQFATANCTSTTVNLGQVIPQFPLSGSVFDLAVTAGTGCKSGNTCTFTVMKNGSATSITCSMTLGASFCADNTHFDTPVAGDTYSIEFTTGATETLANVTATVLAW